MLLQLLQQPYIVRCVSHQYATQLLRRISTLLQLLQQVQQPRDSLALARAICSQ
jgi:hypothetical protein